MSGQGTLPRDVDYRRLARTNGEIAGELAVSNLPRVVAVTARGGDHEPVLVTLRFVEDAQRRVRVSGRVEARLTLTCQRCLEAYGEAMRVDVAGVVCSDERSAANLPRADEPIWAPGDTLDLRALVADEILLALPLVARCGRTSCVARYATSAAPVEDTYRPFASLADRTPEG